MFVVGEIMSRDVVALSEGDTLGSAERYLGLGHIRHLPVVRGKKLVGLVTHRDLLRHAGRVDPKTGMPAAVREVMTREVKTVRPDTPVREAIRLMLGSKIGCLPVTREDGELVGIVTESDLVRVAERYAELLDRREEASLYE